MKITDYKGWARGLKKAGYATDPSYANRLITIIEDYDLFLQPESAELRLLQVDAAATARHDHDVAAGIEELYAERTRWVLEHIGGAYTDPATAFFIINAISNGIGMEEAFGRDTPAPEAFRKTLSAMMHPISRRPT